ncbi:hypothetical protein Tco_0139063 [Tanacetum coccineum]
MVRGKGKAIMKDKKQELTEIKEVDDLEQRIKNLGAIFSRLRDKKLKQKEVVVISDDDKSLDDDTSKDSHDYLSEDSSEDLIKFLSSRDPQWQFPKQSHEEEPKPVTVSTRKKTLCQLMSLCRLRKKAHCHLISSTHFKTLLQLLGVPAQEVKHVEDCFKFIPTSRNYFKFLAQDMSFGWSVITLLTNYLYVLRLYALNFGLYALNYAT